MIEQETRQLEKLRSVLDNHGAEYHILENESNLASAEDGAESGLGPLDTMAPTFILRSKIGYIAAVARGDTRLSYKKIKQHFGLKDVSLASPEEVEQLTGARVGYVALINPGLPTIVDERLLEKTEIYGGTGIPGHTLAAAPQTIVKCTQAEVFDFCELKG